MGCQGIPLATKGIIFCPQLVSSGCTRYVLPFNLSLNTDPIKVSLIKQDPITLNTTITKKQLVLKVLPKSKFNMTRVKKIKLNIKKCEN